MVLMDNGINPFLAERIVKVVPEAVLSLIVEVKPNKLTQIATELQSLGILPEDYVFGKFILISAPSYLVDKIAKIEGVTVHYNMPMTIQSFPFLPQMPTLSITDPILGEVKLPAAVIPELKIFGFSPKLPIPIGKPDTKIIPTSVSKKVVVDVPTQLTGKGVLTAVIDTGLTPAHPQFIGRTVMLETTVPELPLDFQGHGCLRNVNIYTSYCGLVSIEEIWNNLNAEPKQVLDGEYKEFNPNEHVYTVDLDGVTEVKGVFRTRSKYKVVIDTPIGTIESTPWHEFYVAVPRKNKKYNDSHRRWYCGYDIVRKRADELKGSYNVINNNNRDWLVFKAYNGETWSLGGNTRLAYLGALIQGDGVIRYKGIYVKTGKVVTRKNGKNVGGSEIRIADNDYAFLEKLQQIYGGKIKKAKDYNYYYLMIYNTKLTSEVIPYLKPPINDLEALRAWIAGFFDAEGEVDFTKNRVRISNTDKALLELLKNILNTVGIPSTIVSGGVSKGSKSYQLVVWIPQLFYRFVEPYCIKKKEALSKIKRSTDPSNYGRKFKYTGNHILIPVKDVKVVECKDDEYFYDLANTTRKNYTASGFIVSNSWCTAAVGGNSFDITRYSKVEGIATKCDILHVKALSTAGFGSTFSIMKAMEIAYKKGAKVFSMSLGGELQGSIFDDPLIKVVEALSKKGVIAVIAAGNSGPDKHTIGSPGAAPSAVTVGAWSITDQAISWFSSRGPQGAWYKGKEDELQKALNVYGEDAIKPDTCAPGGGRKNKEDKPDEVLYSAVTGWFDGFYDGIPDGFEGMHGTSQATPHVAGLITLLVEAGKVNSSDDVKQVLREKGHTKDEEEGYGLIKLSMFT
jgi:subtilisin family serine protease